MKVDQVIDEYRKGNADKQMSMFLYYRELRDEFACIEQDDTEVHPEACQTSEPLRKSMVQRVLFMLRTRSCCLRSRTSTDRAAP